MAQNASHIIIYRSPISPELLRLCHLAKEFGKPVFFDIDDLVFDTVYTDQLVIRKGLIRLKKETMVQAFELWLYARKL